MQKSGKSAFEQKKQAGSTVNKKINATGRVSKKSANNYLQTLNKLPFAIYTCDAHGLITFYNEAAGILWGRKPQLNKDQWCGSWQIYKSDNTPLLHDICPMALAIKNGNDNLNEEIIIERPDGGNRRVISKPRLLFDESGKLAGAVNTLIDITEKEISELRKKNKSLEHFAFIVSHDLQEPLRKILIYSEMTEENQDDKKEVAVFLKKIRSTSQRMLTLVREVLHYSRLLNQDEKFIETDINNLIQNIESDYELLISEKKASIEYSNLPVINGNPVQLYQLFSNLINNSLKFCERNPKIEITATEVGNDEIKKRFLKDDNRKFIKFIVRDNGIGFERQYAEKIFEMFQRLQDQSQYSGTGIGLALCKQIVENHHGFISAESELNKGTTFYIYLPSIKIIPKGENRNK